LVASEFPHNDYRAAVPVIGPGHTYTTITDKLTSVVLTRHTPLAWFPIVFVAFSLLMGLTVALAYLLAKGIGIWGNNVPVGWAFDIINSGGSALATRARSSRRFCCSSSRTGAPRSTASRKR
jgi:hypothetical protein